MTCCLPSVLKEKVRTFRARVRERGGVPREPLRALECGSGAHAGITPGDREPCRVASGAGRATPERTKDRVARGFAARRRYWLPTAGLPCDMIGSHGGLVAILARAW